MADDAVSIKFGAQFDELSGAINTVTDQISGMTDPIAAVGSAFTGLAEAAGLAFAVDKLNEFTEKMAEMGAQVEHASQMLGLSAEQVSVFQYAAAAMGLGTEGANTALERLERNMSLAVGGNAQAAAAFTALGVSVTDSNGKMKSLDDILPEIADRFAATADGPTKTAVAIALLGRAGAEMIPFLDRGREGLEEFQRMAVETGTVITTSMAAKMEDSSIKAVTMGKAMEGLGLALYSRLQPYVDDLTDSFTRLIEKMTAAFSTSTHLQAIEAIRTEIEKTKQEIADAQKLIASGISPEDLEAQQSAYRQTLEPLGSSTGLLQMPAAVENIKQAAPAAQIASSRIADLTAKLEQLQQQLAAIEKTPEEPPIPSTKPQLPPISTGAGGTDEPEAPADQPTIQSYQRYITEVNRMTLDYSNAQRQVSQLSLDDQKNKLEQEVQASGSSNDQKLAQLKSLYEQSYDLQRDSLEQEMALDSLTPEEKLRIYDQIVELDAKYQLQIQALDKQSQAQVQKNWQSTFDFIDHTMDSVLTGILQGTQTWQQAMAKVFDDLATSFIEDVAKMMVKWAAFEALGIGSNPLTSGVLGGIVSGVSGLFTGGASTFGFGIGGVYDTGAWNIPRDMLAVIHQGEMIIPPDVAASLRGSGGGGGTPPFPTGAASSASSAAPITIIYSPQVTAMDGKSAVAALNDPATMRALATNLGSYIAANPSVRGKY
jgi:hypothetical protein